MIFVICNQGIWWKPVWLEGKIIITSPVRQLADTLSSRRGKREGIIRMW